MSQYSKDSLFRDKTTIDKPFWHLESDGFWHLNYQGERLSKGHTPSKAWLKDKKESQGQALIQGKVRKQRYFIPLRDNCL